MTAGAVGGVANVELRGLGYRAVAFSRRYGPELARAIEDQSLAYSELPMLIYLKFKSFKLLEARIEAALSTERPSEKSKHAICHSVHVISNE